MLSPAVLTLVVLMGSSQVQADWARTDKPPVPGPKCGNGGNILLPSFDNDAWDKVCADLVKDGFVLIHLPTQPSSAPNLLFVFLIQLRPRRRPWKGGCRKLHFRAQQGS